MRPIRRERSKLPDRPRRRVGIDLAVYRVGRRPGRPDMDLCADDRYGGFLCFGVVRRMLSDIATAFAGRKMTLTSEQENDPIE
jgi:hypothetical protein